VGDADAAHKLLVVAGSVVMILGALAVSTAVATAREHSSTNDSLLRECDRYNLDYHSVLRAYGGSESEGRETRRSWWDYAIVVGAVGVFIYLGRNAKVPTLELNFAWIGVLSAVLIVTAALGGWGLWKATRFS
jgi:hypothetical protein